MLHGIVLCLSLVLAVSGAVLSAQFAQGGKAGDAVLAKKKLEEREQKLKKARRLFFGKHEELADRLTLYLSQSGADYMFGRTIDPVEFVFSSILFGMFGGIVLSCVGKSIFFGIAGFFWGCMALYLILEISNRRDNENLLKDIQSMYDTLLIKTQAGLFLVSALSECYRVVSNARLKSALLELSAKIAAEADMDTALDEFNIKFKNQWIDSLCIVIRQSLESGQSVKALTDMSNQMTDVQEAINIRIKEKLNWKVMKVQLLAYAAIIAVCIYGVFIAFMASGNLMNF